MKSQVSTTEESRLRFIREHWPLMTVDQEGDVLCGRFDHIADDEKLEAVVQRRDES